MKCKPMRTAVVGSGAISDIYLKNMIHHFSILEVVAVAAAHKEHAQVKAAEYGIQAMTLEEILSDSSIELIVNLTPAYAHYEIIQRALLAGKHVYTEKVMTEDPVTAHKLNKLAKEKGLYLGSAPDTFLGAALQTARQALDQGLIGQVTSVAASVNRDNNALLSRFSFLRKPGGGVIYDYAVYYMTALVSLLGPVKQCAAFVTAPFPTHVNILEGSPEYGQVMDTPNESEVSAILNFASGITGTLHVNADSVLDEQAFLTIYGTNGILTLTDPNQFGGEIKMLRNHKMGEPESLPEILPCPYAFSENSRGLGPAELAWSCRLGREPRTSCQMAAHVLDVLSEIMESGRTSTFRTVTSTCVRPRPLALPDAEDPESSLWKFI